MVITLCQHNLLTLQLITISAAIIYPLSESFRRIYSLTASKTSEIRLQLFLSSRLSRKCTITFPTTPTKTCSKNLTQSPTSSRKQKLLNLFQKNHLNSRLDLLCSYSRRISINSKQKTKKSMNSCRSLDHRISNRSLIELTFWILVRERKN